MRNVHALIAVAIITFFSGPLFGQEKPTCLMVADECLSKGDVNFYNYQIFCCQKIEIKTGDVLEYDIYHARSNPTLQVSIDARLDGSLDGRWLRDRENAIDQNGLRASPGTELTPASGKWYHRRIPLDSVAGRSSTYWSVGFEGDKKGLYVVFIKNIIIIHADGTTTSIYQSGPVAVNKSSPGNIGYSRQVVMQPVPLEKVVPGADLSSLITQGVEIRQRLARIDGIRMQLAVAKTLLQNDKTALNKIGSAEKELQAFDRNATPSAEETDRVLANVASELQPIAGKIKQYTAYAVGHAHIDTQWKWEWPETVEEFNHTFGQAIKFMAEFPDFKFTQSSSSFYQGTEAAWPELFAKIKEYVKKGQWEIAGGTVCEGDKNIVSGESLARHFLYGQRYFRERFGRQAIVGWEPDTFGHSFQMPQVELLGGCEYYYFMRTGKDLPPLFSYEGLDGSRILAFNEGGTKGGDYSGKISDEELNDLIAVQQQSGAKDVMWVYGVGNHGGGPTRGELQSAQQFMRSPSAPTVKFSTAQEFFEAVSDHLAEGTNSLPVVKRELNFEFTGCYTTHGDIKRLNDDCQAWTVTAEATAAIAARYGFEYPGLTFRQNWEDICWNQQHDTIDGTCINGLFGWGSRAPAHNEPYTKSRQMLGQVLKSDQQIAANALASLAEQIRTEAGSVIVFNPLGCVRDAVVEMDLPSVPAGLVTQEVDSAPSTVPFLDQPSALVRRGIFLARDLPSAGYRVYSAGQNAGVQDVPTVSADGTVLENANLKIVLDAGTGEVKSLLDKRSGHELVKHSGSANRMEIHWEEPSGMPAWDIGKIAKVDVLNSPVEIKIIEKGPVRCTVEFSRPFEKSAITQRVSLVSGAEQADFTLLIDWQEIGSGHPQWPFLKVAFDLNVNNPAATYSIPFGSIVRNTDDAEYPALHWADLTGADGAFGVSLLNDSKHGYSVSGSTMRLSLIRTPTWPDNTTDNYRQVVRYALYPHQGTVYDAGTVNRAMSLVYPVLSQVAGANAGGSLPAEYSFIKLDSPDAVITAIKRAEDDNDLIVRLYESSGMALKTGLSTPWTVQSAKAVNFMEDVLQAGPVMPVNRNAAELNLRPWEIRTIKMELKPVAGIDMRGTRGPGPVRQF